MSSDELRRQSLEAALGDVGVARVECDDVAGWVASAGASPEDPLAAEAWVFGGWVAATRGWLVHNASTRIDTPLGVAETTLALDRLLRLRASLPELVAVLADTG